MGPTLYIVYTNDIPSILRSSNKSFIDDLSIYRIIRCSKDTDILQTDLDKLTEWSKKWGQAISHKKCIHLRITKKQTQDDPSSTYALDGKEVLRKPEAKYLGLLITSDLNFNKHIQGISSQAMRVLGFLKRNLWHCSENAKKEAYSTLVRPCLEYLSPVWDPYTTVNTHKVEMVQRRAARFVAGINRFTLDISVTDIMKNLKWPSLQQRRAERRRKILYSIVFGPPTSLQTFKVERAPTRAGQRHLTLIRPFHKTNRGRDSFLPKAIKEWNATIRELPNQLTEEETRQVMRRRR